MGDQPHTQVSVISYNILAAAFATRRWELSTPTPTGNVISLCGRSMPDVAQQYLTWTTRRKKICQELLEADADIICLQELDRRWGKFLSNATPGVRSNESREERKC